MISATPREHITINHKFVPITLNLFDVNRCTNIPQTSLPCPFLLVYPQYTYFWLFWWSWHLADLPPRCSKVPFRFTYYRMQLLRLLYGSSFLSSHLLHPYDVIITSRCCASVTMFLRIFQKSQEWALKSLVLSVLTKVHKKVVCFIRALLRVSNS